MKALREEQAAQAIEYLKVMNCAKLFRDAVCQSSEFIRRFFAEMYECSDLANVMRKLEENGSLPYYVTHEYMPFGECYSILTVSPYVEDFIIATPKYIQELGAYRAYGYVWNVTDDSKSEPGEVYVKNEYGMLTRTL